MLAFLPAVFLAGYRCLPRFFRAFYLSSLYGGIIGELLQQKFMQIYIILWRQSDRLSF
jgi:hypothetical protein